MPEPKLIDHFEVIGELGQGGMGKVYLARDTWLERKVAIKVVTVAAMTDDQRTELLKRLIQEAKTAAALDHPGIVTVYQVGVHTGERGDEPYIVMPFIDGPT